MLHGRYAHHDLLSHTRSQPSRLLFQGACQLLAVAMLLVLAGCSKRYDDIPAFLPFNLGENENHGVGRFKTSYLVDQIDLYYRGTNPGPIGVTTFVNIDDLYSTSTFGRMVGEQLMSELAMRGYDVVELRHSDALQFLAPDGEFALSRDLGVVRRERQLGGIVVGTYVVSPVRVYLNARLINPASSMVLSAGSVEMSKTPELVRLLRGGSLPASLERIPVRHMNSLYGTTLYPNSNAWRYNMEEMESAPRVVAPQIPVQPATPKAQLAR